MPTLSSDNERFSTKLVEQIGFIQRSCSAYDEGLEEEAIRIATSLRIIFHDTSKSTSLITHLGIGAVPMLSSAKGRGNLNDYIAWILSWESIPQVTDTPQFGDKFQPVNIKRWWDGEVVLVHDNRDYTRRKIILATANTDGGAHVAEKLDEFYRALGEGTQGISLVVNMSKVPETERGIEHRAKNAHLAMIRQFAFEFLAAVRRFKWERRIGVKPKI